MLNATAVVRHIGTQDSLEWCTAAVLSILHIVLCTAPYSPIMCVALHSRMQLVVELDTTSKTHEIMLYLHAVKAALPAQPCLCVWLYHLRSVGQHPCCETGSGHLN